MPPFSRLLDVNDEMEFQTYVHCVHAMHHTNAIPFLATESQNRSGI